MTKTLKLSYSLFCLHLDNRVYGVVDGNIQMDTPRKDQYEEQNRYDYVSDPVAITDHEATVSHFNNCMHANW